jgi:ABC-type transporter Mla MlaB component
MEPNSTVFTVRGPISRTDLPGLCGRACRLLHGSDAKVVVCEVGEHVAADAVAIDALARLELAAKRLGRHVVLRNVSPELRELLAFCGIDGLRIESGRQAEQREEACRIEEERQLGDPAV